MNPYRILDMGKEGEETPLERIVDEVTSDMDQGDRLELVKERARGILGEGYIPDLCSAYFHRGLKHPSARLNLVLSFMYYSLHSLEMGITSGRPREDYKEVAYRILWPIPDYNGEMHFLNMNFDTIMDVMGRVVRHVSTEDRMYGSDVSLTYPWYSGSPGMIHFGQEVWVDIIAYNEMCDGPELLKATDMSLDTSFDTHEKGAVQLVEEQFVQVFADDMAQGLKDLLTRAYFMNGIHFDALASEIREYELAHFDPEESTFLNYRLPRPEGLLVAGCIAALNSFHDILYGATGNKNTFSYHQVTDLTKPIIDSLGRDMMALEERFGYDFGLMLRESGAKTRRDTLYKVAGLYCAPFAMLEGKPGFDHKDDDGPLSPYGTIN